MLLVAALMGLLGVVAKADIMFSYQHGWGIQDILNTNDGEYPTSATPNSPGISWSSMPTGNGYNNTLTCDTNVSTGWYWLGFTNAGSAWLDIF